MPATLSKTTQTSEFVTPYMESPGAHPFPAERHAKNAERMLQYLRDNDFEAYAEELGALLAAARVTEEGP
jgi:hypothetical protein